ncbi:MAG: ABC transporter ATP-binding protein, partial [Candidatus Omnitrophota bacterium]|nr:ABC transporter ATP-binding protein [Candidatus Omnitrophota bacterium]
ITYDAILVRDSITTGLMDLFDQPIQIITGLFIIVALKAYFDISWLLIFLSIILLPAILYPVRLLGKKLKKLSRQSQEKMGDINNALYETISGIRIVKAFSMESYEKNRFKQHNERFYKLSMKAIKRIEVISPMSECAIIICTVWIILIAGRGVVEGTLSAGAFTAFVGALALMAKPAKRLAKVYGVLQTAMAAGNRIFDVLDEEPKIIERPGAKVLPPFKENIAFSNISFKYDNTDVLKDISFKAGKGDIIALVGPSGVGKTTLVNLIPRFYDPTSGFMRIDEFDSRDVTIKSLREQIGIVTQETILFNDTVTANIGYGKAGESNKKAVINAAKIASAHDFIMKMPLGYETVIGERGFRLSGGEKQRVAIARAVFKNPPILILDEATSQLDSESEILVQSAIDRLMKGRTVFVIAHRLSTIKNATKILVLDKGGIVEQGAHDELMERSGLYRKLYDMQFRET